MKKILIYGVAIISYLWISAKLRDKKSDLWECIKKCADKLACMLNKVADNDASKKVKDVADAYDGKGAPE